MICQIEGCACANSGTQRFLLLAHGLSCGRGNATGQGSNAALTISYRDTRKSVQAAPLAQTCGCLCAVRTEPASCCVSCTNGEEFRLSGVAGRESFFPLPDALERRVAGVHAP